MAFFGLGKSKAEKETARRQKGVNTLKLVVDDLSSIITEVEHNIFDRDLGGRWTLLFIRSLSKYISFNETAALEIGKIFNLLNGKFQRFSILDRTGQMIYDQKMMMDKENVLNLLYRLSELLTQEYNRLNR